MRMIAGAPEVGEGQVVLLLAGQGAQRPGMAVGLYDVEPVFTAVMDEVFAQMGEEGRHVRADWLSQQPRVSIDDASRAQPLLFAVNYALARTLRAHGVPVSVLLGHSIGELAAAGLAGVFDLRHAAEILLARSAAMAETPPGGMLAVAAAAEELTGLLGSRENAGNVVVAAINAPRQIVLAGPEVALARMQDQLSRAGLACRPVRARQAFHSPAAASAVPVLRQAFARRPLRVPTVPIQSTRTGRVVAPAEATDPGFWAGQVATPVLFWAALTGVLDGSSCRNGSPRTVVGAGPAQELSVLARRHPAVRCGRAHVAELPAPGPRESATPWLASVEVLVSRSGRPVHS